MPAREVVLQPGEGTQLSAPRIGIEVSVKLRAEDTGGAYSALIYSGPPGFQGPPPHTHQQDEACLVLSGEITHRIGERTVRQREGGFVLVPGNVPHTFSFTGETRTSVLWIFSPGGFEGFFEEMVPLVEQHGYPPPPDVLAPVAQKYGMQVAGPPPGSG